jgi:hypothetical protein
LLERLQGRESLGRIVACEGGAQLGHGGGSFLGGADAQGAHLLDPGFHLIRGFGRGGDLGGLLRAASLAGVIENRFGIAPHVAEAVLNGGQVGLLHLGPGVDGFTPARERLGRLLQSSERVGRGDGSVHRICGRFGGLRGERRSSRRDKQSADG